MKTKSLLLLTFTLPLATSSAAPPSSDKAELKLSYDSLSQLVESLQKEKSVKAPAPPVRATIRKALYNLDLTNPETAQLTATFSITTFGNDWVTLPLLSADYALQSVDPSSTVLTPSNGSLSFLTKGTGEHEITVNFLSVANKDNSFTLDFLPATSAQLQLNRGKDYKVTGTSSLTPELHILPTNGGTVQISPADQVIEQAPIETVWRADSRALYTVIDSELHAQARVQLTARQGDPADEVNIIIPQNSRIIDVIGPDLAEWTGINKNNQQSIDVRWDNQGINRRRLTLIYALPLPNEDETWTLSIPRLEAPENTRGQLALITPSEFSPLTTKQQPTIAMELIPDWMKSSGIPLAVKLQQAQAVPFTLKRLTQIHAATATVKTAQFKTQIVDDGSTLSEGVIRITHRDPMPWTFNLPDGCSILNCTIGNQPRNPIALDDGSLQLTLPSPQQSNDSDTLVKISFTSKVNEMAPVEGKLSLSLPSTPLFIHSLTWDISLPSEYETTALDGNLTFSPNNKRTGSISLVKKLSRNQAAQTDIFYQKRNQ